MESPPRLSEKARPSDDDTIICRSSFSVRSKIRTVRGQSVFSPVPRRDGYNTLDFVPKSVCQPVPSGLPKAGEMPCQRDRTFLPRVYGMSGMYGIFGGCPSPHFYRTYRALPYTFPPQKDDLSILRAPGTVADAVLSQQVILPHVQRPHDPVRRKSLCAVHG